ncbi:MAG: glycosyltransferase, partial [Bacteroidetes bacterium]|nr:glycosyltransferase [Bacteroidota bacterium]
PERQKIAELAKKLPTNIEWEIRGHISQDELIYFYKKQPINLFIHLSESEGLPLSIVEAISFGIPAMASAVGGVPEIISENSGILLPVELDPEQIAIKIETFKNSSMNTEVYRKKVKEFWNENFEAKKNYNYFYQKLVD